MASCLHIMFQKMSAIVTLQVATSGAEAAVYDCFHRSRSKVIYVYATHQMSIYCGVLWLSIGPIE